MARIGVILANPIAMLKDSHTCDETKRQTGLELEHSTSYQDTYLKVDEENAPVV